MKRTTILNRISCLMLLASVALPLAARGESRIVTVTNTEDKPLAISSISIDGEDTHSFSQTNNCGKSLGVGKSCTVDVRFTPTSPGQKEASLMVRNSEGNLLTAPVSLSGTGIENAGHSHDRQDKDEHEGSKDKDSHEHKSSGKDR